MVVASSAHRRDALEAVQYGIDGTPPSSLHYSDIFTEIKARVPIWKKEVYEDGSTWKENCEGCHYHQSSNTQSHNDNDDHTHTKHLSEEHKQH